LVPNGDQQLIKSPRRIEYCGLGANSGNPFASGTFDDTCLVLFYPLGQFWNSENQFEK
jgi:hypothetical protein